MTPEQQAAYVQAQASAAMIEALGMLAANKQREGTGMAPAYDEHHFRCLIDNYGLHHNALIGTFRS